MQKPGADRGMTPMTPERWRAVNAILRGALTCEWAQRDAFVAEACGADEELRREVASLLAAHDPADDFLERPAAAVFADASAAPLTMRLADCRKPATIS